jgi:tetratricopeptide (TPR) repeat protein
LNPRGSRIPRIILALSLVSVLALIGWAFSQRTRDHWKEVAQARRFLERGQAKQAFEAVAMIHDQEPGAAEGMTLGAQALLTLGRVAQARRVLERSLVMNPDQADAAKMLAAIYLASSDGQRAISLLKMAARLEPNDFRPWYALGKAYHDLGNLQESADAYAQALQRSPPAPEAREARLGRVRSLLDANRALEASSDLELARNLYPEDPMVLALAARQARDLGRWDESIVLADRALAIQPECLDALLARARARFQNGQRLEAIDDLKHALKINPNEVGALQLLSQVQRSVGMAAEAAATQEQATKARDRMTLMGQLAKLIDQYPGDPVPRYRMGEAAMEGEMNVLAYQCFRAALDIDPDYEPARTALRKLRREKKFDPQTMLETQPRFTATKPAIPAAAR